MGLKSRIVNAIIVGSVMGAYIVYAEPIMAWLQSQNIMPAEDTSTMYGLVGIVVIFFAEIVAFVLTSGMDKEKKR